MNSPQTTTAFHDPFPGPLCELFLVVRPEDKLAVSRALESEIGTAFICHHALGRGYEGGLNYSTPQRSDKWLAWFKGSQMLAFLPKIVFWAILDRQAATNVIERVGAAVRLTGGPTQCAGGFAVLADIEQELPAGITPGKGHQNCSDNNNGNGRSNGHHTVYQNGHGQIEHAAMDPVSTAGNIA